MPDSWQELDGDGVLMDWTSADTIRIIDTYHACNAIARAYRERCNAINSSNPSVWNPPNTIARLTDYSYIKSTMYGTYGFSGIFFTQFANPNIDPYSYDGGTTPDRWIGWQTAQILSEIGDAALIEGPNNLNELTAWMHQTYKVINLMRRHLAPAGGAEDSYPPNINYWAGWSVSVVYTESLFWVVNPTTINAVVDVYSIWESGARVKMLSGVSVAARAYSAQYARGNTPYCVIADMDFKFKDW